MKERLARGHNTNLEPVANWDIPVLAGAGALRSTANDLFTFLDMCMGNKRTQPRALCPMLPCRRGCPQPDQTVSEGASVTLDGREFDVLLHVLTQVRIL